MPTSDEDLAKQADKVQALREKVAAAENERLERERSAGNEVAMLQLQAEEERLNADLILANNSKKAASVKEGQDAPLAAAKAQLELAVSARKAAEEAVKNPPEGTVPTSTPPEEVAELKKEKGGGN